MFHFQGKNYQNIVWDFNGTILDDFKLCFNIINEVLKDRNMNLISEYEYQQNFQIPVKPFYEKLGFDFVKEDFTSISKEWVAKYDEGVHECGTQQHFADTIKDFHTKDLKQFVISACEETRLLAILEKLELSPIFKGIYGMTALDGLSKVHLAHKFMDEHEVCPKETVVIGDTDHDKDLADEIGCDCILYYSGHQSIEVLEKTGLPVIDCYSNIVPIK